MFSSAFCSAFDAWLHRATSTPPEHLDKTASATYILRQLKIPSYHIDSFSHVHMMILLYSCHIHFILYLCQFGLHGTEAHNVSRSVRGKDAKIVSEQRPELGWGSSEKGQGHVIYIISYNDISCHSSLECLNDLSVASCFRALQASTDRWCLVCESFAMIMRIFNHMPCATFKYWINLNQAMY